MKDCIRRLLGASLSFVVLASLLAATPASAGPQPQVGLRGFSLEEASHSAEPLRLGCGEVSEPIGFAAAAGKGNAWHEGQRGVTAQYLISLKVRVSRLPGARAGFASIIAEADGQHSASVQVSALRDAGATRWRWGTIDLLRGSRVGGLKPGPTLIETTNYLPFNSVRPGSNRIRFRVECSGAAPVASFAVLPSTRLRETIRQPAHLRLTATGADPEPEVGKVTSVSFEILNSGDLPARDVEVRIEPDGDGVRPVGREEYRYGGLMGAARGSFLVVPRKDGRLKVEVLASSGNANRPAVVLGGAAVRQAAHDSSHRSLPLTVLFGVLSVVALVLFAWHRRAAARRRRAKGRELAS